MSKNGAQHALI